MSAPAGDRFILVAEVADRARLFLTLGDKETHHAVERCINRMERAATSFKGVVAEVREGRLAAGFACAGAALDAAVEMQARIEALPPVSGVTLAIRVGIDVEESVRRPDVSSGNAGDVLSQLSAIGAPGRILVSGKVVDRLPLPQQAMARPVDGIAMAVGATGRVFEIVRTGIGGSGTMSPDGPAPIVRLRLRVSGSDTFLGPDRPMASMGRDSGSDIVIRDSRASRNHGHIELRRDRYVLVDRSTNGTYVSFDGGEQLVLRCDEAVLCGRGQIRLGHSTGAHMDELVEFEVLG